MNSILLRWRRGFVAVVLAMAASRADSAELSPKVHDLIDRFFSPPDFTHLQLSPDGTHVLVEKEIKGQVELITIDLKTGKRASTASEPGRYVTGAQWVGQNQILFEIIEDAKTTAHATYATDATRLTKTFIRHIYGGHWIVDAGLSKIWQVPTLEHVMTLVDEAQQSPNRILMVEQWRDNFYSPLYCYDPAKNQTRILERNPGRIVGWTADAAGQVRLARVAELHDSYSYLYRENELSPWGPITLPPDTEPVTFDVGGHNLLIAHRDDTGRFVVQPYDLAAKQLAAEKWSDPIYDVDPELLRDPRTGAPQALAYETDRGNLVWLNLQLKGLHASLAAAFPGAYVYPIGTTDVGDVLLWTQSDVSPLRYFMLSRQRGQIGLFLDPTPKLRELKLSPMQPVMFQTRDGANVYGYLTMPLNRVGEKPPPLIALSHGGPSVRDIWGYDPAVQYFATLGYAVLQVNYRGSAGYGHAYALRNLIEVGHQSVDDVADGIRWAIGKGYADPKRIVVYGASYGGYISVALAVRYPKLPCCTIARSGVYDWEFQLKSDSDEYRETFRLNADYFPEVGANAARYHAISPVYQAAEIEGPVLLVHGRDDERVKVAQSELMARALKKAGKSVELVRDPEGQHGLRLASVRREFYERATEFLLKYAPPDVLP